MSDSPSFSSSSSKGLPRLHRYLTHAFCGPHCVRSIHHNGEEVKKDQSSSRRRRKNRIEMIATLPYEYTFRAPVKGRWIGRPLLEVFLHEFSYIPPPTPPFFASSSTIRRERSTSTEKEEEEKKSVSNGSGACVGSEAATMEPYSGAATRDVRVALPAYVNELVEGKIRLLGREEECREAGKVYQYRLQLHCAAHCGHPRHHLSPSLPPCMPKNDGDRPFGHVCKGEETVGGAAVLGSPCRTTAIAAKSIVPSSGIVVGGKEDELFLSSPTSSPESSFCSWDEAVRYMHSLPSLEAASACLSALWATAAPYPSCLPSFYHTSPPPLSFSSSRLDFPSLRLRQKDTIQHDVRREEGWLFAPSSLPPSRGSGIDCGAPSPLPGFAKPDPLEVSMTTSNPYLLQILGCTLLSPSLSSASPGRTSPPPLLLVYKPPGMPVHPSGRYRENTVTAIIERLLYRRPPSRPAAAAAAKERTDGAVVSGPPHASDLPIARKGKEMHPRGTTKKEEEEEEEYVAVENFFPSASFSSSSSFSGTATETERMKRADEIRAEKNDQWKHEGHAAMEQKDALPAASSASSLYAGYVSIVHRQPSFELLRIWIQKEDEMEREERKEETNHEESATGVATTTTTTTTAFPPTPSVTLVSQGIPLWLWMRWKMHFPTPSNATNDAPDEEEEEGKKRKESADPHHHHHHTLPLPSQLYVVHRLDAATSGVLLFGLTAAAAREVAPLIAHKENDEPTEENERILSTTSPPGTPTTARPTCLTPTPLTEEVQRPRRGRESGWCEKLYLARVHGCFQPEQLACHGQPHATYCTLLPLPHTVDHGPIPILSLPTAGSPHSPPFSFSQLTTSGETEKERRALPPPSPPKRESDDDAISSCAVESRHRPPLASPPPLYSTLPSLSHAVRVDMPIGCASYPQALYWYPSRWTNADVAREEKKRIAAQDERKRTLLSWTTSARSFFPSPSSVCVSPTTRRKWEATESDTSMQTHSPYDGEDAAEHHRRSTHHTEENKAFDGVWKEFQPLSTPCQGEDTRKTRRKKTPECGPQRALKREYMAECCRGREYVRRHTSSTTSGKEEEEGGGDKGGKKEEARRDTVERLEDMEAAVRTTAKVASSMFHVCFYDAQRDESVVCARLYTGRTHQLRVHLAALGHPIVGDQKYIHMSKKNTRGKPKVEAHVDEETGKKRMGSIESHHTIAVVPTRTAEKETTQREEGAPSQPIEEDRCRPKSERTEGQKKGNEGKERREGGYACCLCPEGIQLHAWQYTLHLPWKHGDRSKTTLVCSAPPPATLWYGEDD